MYTCLFISSFSPSKIDQKVKLTKSFFSAYSMCHSLCAIYYPFTIIFPFSHISYSNLHFSLLRFNSLLLYQSLDPLSLLPPILALYKCQSAPYLSFTVAYNQRKHITTPILNARESFPWSFPSATLSNKYLKTSPAPVSPLFTFSW